MLQILYKNSIGKNNLVLLQRRRLLLQKSSNNGSSSISTTFNSGGLFTFCRHKTTDSKALVSLQLDYYMSSQFAGIACAMKHNLYDSRGIELQFLPICPVGEEMHRVRDCATNTAAVAVGSIEQNIFTPTLQRHPELKLKSMAAMFRQSPLCLASLSKDGENTTNEGGEERKLIIGAHEDTVPLINRILNTSTSDSKYSVIASPRSSKNTDLLKGNVDLIQAYTTTEVLTLERILQQQQQSNNNVSVRVDPLEGMDNTTNSSGGVRLGYAQVLFATEEDLEYNSERREILKSFLDVTFRGWEMAIRDVPSAAQNVREIQSKLGLDDENNDHWDTSSSSLDYTIQSVGLCCDYVKETFQGDRYGVIDAKRWNEATNWLLSDTATKNDAGINENTPTANLGLDVDVWQPSSKLLAGNELARRELVKANESALEFYKVHGRKPSLAIITVGDLPRYGGADRRLNIYSNDSNSWFNKVEVGQSNGFKVKDIHLTSDTTTDEVLSILRNLKQEGGEEYCDGIQLMWPLPPQLDVTKLYNAIDQRQDVDGAHYMGQCELGPSSAKTTALPPVTPAAVMDLLDEYSIDVRDKRVLVVGRSRIVGSPLAYMLRDNNAIVTVVHSDVSYENLKREVRASDIVISCAGEPNLLKAEWLSPEAEVINVGTTFWNDKLVSDFDESDLSQYAKRYSPVPGGIGPLSVASLFKNVAKSAWNRMEEDSYCNDIESTWTEKSASLHRTVHFENYNVALDFVNQVNDMSTNDMDHHANISFQHHCVDGVDVTLEFFTYEVNDLTEKDYQAARKVNTILNNFRNNTTTIINMSDFTYDLKEESIAMFPAEPRGSSRLLRVEPDGTIQHYDKFSNHALSLLQDSHIVFNESKVVNARLSVSDNNNNNDTKNNNIEMMILDLGDENLLQKHCTDAKLKVMIRKENVQKGETFYAEEEVNTPSSPPTTAFRVSEVIGPWLEDDSSDGNGTECWVEFLFTDGNHSSPTTTVGSFLERAGSVPIPPYLNRNVEASDTTSYNNVYASGEGSVAAPTAGLHFTNSILKQIGSDNITFLTLHVGAGTFKPVLTENAYDHAMHGENFVVSVTEIKRIIQSLQKDKPLVVVGTTSCRTLESLYWCGVKQILQLKDKKKKVLLHQEDNDNMLTLEQHEWRELMNHADNITAIDAFNAIIDNNNNNNNIIGKTSLMITPGYDFKIVHNLVTNFHAPDSTLMLLVSAFLNNNTNSTNKVTEVYNEAQNLGYKFLSYGDVCYFSRRR